MRKGKIGEAAGIILEGEITKNSQYKSEYAQNLHSVVCKMDRAIGRGECSPTSVTISLSPEEAATIVHILAEIGRKEATTA